MKTFVILKVSGATGKTCLLGEGDSKDAAWEDAYGPKPWTDFSKKSAKDAFVKEVSEDELNDLRSNA